MEREEIPTRVQFSAKPETDDLVNTEEIHYRPENSQNTVVRLFKPAADTALLKLEPIFTTGERCPAGYEYRFSIYLMNPMVW